MADWRNGQGKLKRYKICEGLLTRVDTLNQNQAADIAIVAIISGYKPIPLCITATLPVLLKNVRNKIYTDNKIQQLTGAETLGCHLLTSQ